MERICRRDGTVLVDFLMTLLITVLLIPIVVFCLSVLSKCLVVDGSLQDMVATYQLRRILALSYDPYLEEDTLYFRYRKKDMRLSLVNDHIIIQPGTQIIYNNVDTCSFYEENDVIYIVYEREGKEYHEALTKK